jgi:hypothetical protein
MLCKRSVKQQAFKEQQSIFGGLGGLPGAAIGGSLLSGKGTPSFGGSNPFGGLSTKPFGALWSKDLLLTGLF